MHAAATGQLANSGGTNLGLEQPRGRVVCAKPHPLIPFPPRAGPAPPLLPSRAISCRQHGTLHAATCRTACGAQDGVTEGHDGRGILD